MATKAAAAGKTGVAVSGLATTLKEDQAPDHQLNALMCQLGVSKMNREMILNNEEIGDVEKICSPKSLFKLCHLKYREIDVPVQKILGEALHYSTLYGNDDLDVWEESTFQDFIDSRKRNKWTKPSYRGKRKVRDDEEFEKVVSFASHSRFLDRMDLISLSGVKVVSSLDQLAEMEHLLNRYELDPDVLGRRNQAVLGMMVTHARLNDVLLKDYTAEDHLDMLEINQEHFLDMIGVPAYELDGSD